LYNDDELSEHYLSEAVRKEISRKSKAEAIVENWSVNYLAIVIVKNK
jgi:hypothetical protein